MTSFLVFYYAMGWVAEALNFIVASKTFAGRNPFWPASILAWPILMPLYIFLFVFEYMPKIKVRKEKEYLWKRP